MAECPRARVLPSGSPAMARTWFSNWLVSAPSMVQCPELCTRGAISLAISRAADHEEFDGEHADVIEMFEQPPRGALRLARERRAAKWRARQSEDAFTVHVEIERIKRDPSVEPAHRDHRHFLLEGHQVFVQQRRRPQCRPCGVEVAALAQHELALAVVTQAPGLEHAGQADRLHRERRAPRASRRRHSAWWECRAVRRCASRSAGPARPRARAAAARSAPCRAGSPAPPPGCFPSRR